MAVRTDGQSPHGPGVETHEEDRRQPGRFRRETGRIGQACAKGKLSGEIEGHTRGGDGDAVAQAPTTHRESTKA